METIIGIDLGTTNSEVAVIRDGRPVVLPDDDGDPILPSVVGLDAEGKLIVGKAARNQFMLAPERTIRSIKRKMGRDETVQLGTEQLTPQEVSAVILRALKQRAERALGHHVKKAVITVPAFFTEGQREATREAGELAGLEVVRIINEPTAAVLTYDPNPPNRECLLVYDLGGGTFDVSVAQVESGVIEILASHGDTQLGGDDFDQRLLDFVCDRFQHQHKIDLRATPVARSRALRAVEDAKKMLSTEVITEIAEEFIAEANGVPLHLKMEIERHEYESLIEPLVARTLACLDRALTDAKVQSPQIDKVVLVGGATRTPLVHLLLKERLGRPVHSEIEPDLAVAMGAAVQGALIAGMDVGPVLVDITPHTLGIEAVGIVHDMLSHHKFVPIIERNTPLPAIRTEIVSTMVDGQKSANIIVLQGEYEDTRMNTLVGEFRIEGLADVPSGNQILVRLDLDLSGILKVSAIERATGLSRHVVIDNAMERLRTRQRTNALDRLESADDDDLIYESEFHETLAEELSPILQAAVELIIKAEQLLPDANPEDASELSALLVDLKAAVERRSEDDIRPISAEVENIVFYLQDT